jgi:hypothetical protein
MEIPPGRIWQNDNGAQRVRKDGAHLLASRGISAVPVVHGVIVGPSSAHVSW